jgi:HK97 family phage prohead protease
MRDGRDAGDPTRRAPAAFAPATLDQATRTVQVTASTGARVKRYGFVPDGSFGPWHEELDLAGADTARLIGAPVLTDHDATFDGLVGTVEAFRIEAGGLVASLRFARGTRAEAVMQAVHDGHLRTVSVGYRIQQMEAAGDAEDGAPIFRAVRWQPLEISFVPIPADPAATVRAGVHGAPCHRTEENMMTIQNPAPQGGAMPSQTMAEAIVAARQEETERVRNIGAAGRALGIADDEVNGAIERGMPLAEAQSRFIGLLEARRAREGGPIAGGVNTLDINPTRRLEAASEALACRVTGATPSEQARAFMGGSIANTLRQIAEARGERLPRNESDAELIQRALSTSDLPQLLTGTMQRILQARLVAAPGSIRMIAAPRTVRDFREFRFLQFAGIASMERIPEGGPIPMAPPAERGEAGSVATYAVQLPITRQALVNDDLGALDQVNLFANGVIATEAAQFVTMFATNGAGWGPTLTDGVPLFHADHGNVASGAVGTTGISAGRIVMRAQTDANDNLVAPSPRYLLVGPAGETAAEQALNQIAVVSTSESSRPVFAGRMEHTVEPRLSGAPWFLFADPSQAPVIALVTLEGSNGSPTITRHETSNFDGLNWKLVHDFAVVPVSHVGAVRLTGS